MCLCKEKYNRACRIAIGSLLTNSFGFQLIFRKVSDVKREKELAERRKNDPPPDISQDHLVRKIFSRFKKSGDRSNSQQGLRCVGAGDIEATPEMARL